MALAGYEPANLGTKSQYATPRPPKHYYAFVKKENIALVSADGRSLGKMFVLNAIFTHRLMAHEDFIVSIHTESIKYLTLSFVHEWAR